MIIVEFETDVPLLRHARRRAPDATLTFEAERARTATGDDEPIHLLFWASGGDLDAFEAALDGDPTVTRVRRLADPGGRRLYRVVYTDAGLASTTYPLWVDLDATVLHAEATGDRISVRMRFPDRGDVTTFRAWFDERGLPFTVTGFYAEDRVGEADGGVGLSEKQREAIRLAWERGYFDIPRGVDLVEVAAELGISDSAASQRMRRGIQSLIEDEFGDRPTPDSAVRVTE